MAYTLCRMTDRMMTTYLTQLETQFVTEGGIKERMTAARTGYRADKKQELDAAYREIASLKAEIARLNAIIEELTKKLLLIFFYSNQVFFSFYQHPYRIFRILLH